MSITLKPLSQDSILTMESSDLWFVRIGRELFGPFHTNALKFYAQDNRKVFLQAECTNIHESKWIAFFEQDVFKSDLIKDNDYAGPFWILRDGQKSPPLARQDIERLMNHNELGSSDPISCDDGETWSKIYHLSAFQDKTHTPEQLPPSPTEFSPGHIEKHEDPTKEGMTALAFLGQQLHELQQAPKIDEYPVNVEAEAPIHSSMKWAIPMTLTGVLVVGLMIHTVIKDNPEAPAAATADTENTIKPERAIASPDRPYRREEMPLRRNMPLPRANYEDRSELTRPDSHHVPTEYPAHVETHDTDRAERQPAQQDDPPEPKDTAPDPYGQPTQAASSGDEPSLVAPQVTPKNEDQTLDAAMGGAAAETMENPAPTGESASDF